MKKIFTMFSAVLFAANMMAASYGIMVDGTYYPGTANPTPGDPSFQEYMVLGVSVSNGATLQLYDQDNSAGWAVNLDPASVTTIVKNGDYYTCSADGCYDFYIKLKYQNDQLYIGSCSGTDPGDNPGGGQTASYGIMINGTDYHAGVENPTPGDPSFKEYMVLGVSVAANATLQLYDAGNNAGWAVDLDPASVTTITKDGDHYVCSADGCYDFYIKLKMNADQLYIGSCSGSNPGDNPGDNPGGDTPNEYWYWKGYVDGGDIQNEEGGFNIFVGGMSSIVVEEGAYLFVMHQIKGVPGDQYMSTAYVDGPSHATMVKTGTEKLHVPVGSWTLYLYDNGDGSVELSYEQLPGKTLVGGGSQAIENTKAANKAYKTIINGRLVIIRGEKKFDATGREL